MPFGPYKDFEECTRKNKDKKSPNGYCAVIHKNITDKWPSENKKGNYQMKSNEIRKIANKIVNAISTFDFEVKDFDPVDASKKSDGSFEVIYEGDFSKVKGTITFDKAKINRRGYEPTNVSKDGDDIIVTFEKAE